MGSQHSRSGNSLACTWLHSTTATAAATTGRRVPYTQNSELTNLGRLFFILCRITISAKHSQQYLQLSNFLLTASVTLARIFLLLFFHDESQVKSSGRGYQDWQQHRSNAVGTFYPPWPTALQFSLVGQSPPSDTLL